MATQRRNLPKEVPTVDDDASTLERILSGIPDGRVTALSYARQLAFTDDRYKELIRDFDTDKKQDIGHLCRKHEIEPQDFLADINRAAYPVIEEAQKLAHGIARDIVTKRIAKVVERGMIEGGKKDGVADRHFTLQNEGFHPAPKGLQIQMNQVNQQSAGLPSFEDATKELSDILSTGADEEHMLTEGETDYIDVEVDEKEEQLV